MTRRHALLGITAVSASAAGVAANAPDENIRSLERLHDLADELSALLADYEAEMGSRWELRVRAPADPCPVLFTNVSSITPARRVQMARRELIAATKAMHPDVAHWSILDTRGCEDVGALATMFVLAGHQSPGALS